MGVLSDLVSNPGKALGSDLTGGNSAVGQTGKSLGICGRTAMANPIVEALAGAALAYFDPLSMVSGLGGLTGLGMGANAGLITGGLAGLSTGNLSTGLQAGLYGWTGGSLASGMAGSAASKADAINQLGTQQLQPTTAQTAANNAISVNTAQPYDTINYSANPVAANPATAGTGASNPLSASTTTAAPSAAPITTQAATTSANNPSMFSKAVNYVTDAYAKCAPMTLAAGAGATSLAAKEFKKAAAPNTVSAPVSPSSNVIRQYSYNPYTGQYAAGPVTNAANFGTQAMVPVNYCKNKNTYSASTGGIVALANGGMTKARQLASQGRGDDSELLHVTPGELQGLNTIKKKLTGAPLPINPHTGLHEAGFFSDFFSTNPVCALKSVTTDLTGGNSGIAAIGNSIGLGPNNSSPANCGISAMGNHYGLGSNNCSTVKLTPLTTLSGMTPCQAKQLSLAQINALSPDVAGTLTGSQIAQFNPSQLAAYDAVMGINPATNNSIGNTGAVETPTTPANPTYSTIPIPPGGNRNTLGSLLSMYEMGGGSVGAPIISPVSQDQFNQMYNTMSGDSANAYNFLMGKTTQPKTTAHRYNGQVAVPYACYIQNPNGYATGGITGLNQGGQAVGHLGGYSDGGRLLRGPGDGVSDSIPATIGAHNPEPARLADGEFVVPARIVSELGNGSTEAGARKLYQMMDRIQKNRSHSVGHNKVAVNSHSDKFLPA